MTNFGKLRRVAIAAMAASLAVGFGAQAWAHGGHHGRDRGAMADPAKMDERIESMVKRMLSRVDATDEQRAKVSAIAKQAATDLRGMREKQRAVRAKGVELLSAPTVDRAAIESLRTEQMKLADEASRRVSLAMADSAEVLTPEQRAKLAQGLKERQARWSERHKPRG